LNSQPGFKVLHIEGSRSLEILRKRGQDSNDRYNVLSSGCKLMCFSL
jgi:hypothetical protein